MSYWFAGIDADGRVEIPREMRDSLGLAAGDLISFEIVDGRVVITRSASRLATIFGAVQPSNRPEDFKAIREHVQRAIAEEIVEGMRRERPPRDWKSRGG